MTKKVDIKIIQKPIFVKYDCPYCKDEVDWVIEGFEDEVGTYPANWSSTKFTCPMCGYKLKINDVYWE